MVLDPTKIFTVLSGSEMEVSNLTVVRVSPTGFLSTVSLLLKFTET